MLHSYTIVNYKGCNVFGIIEFSPSFAWACITFVNITNVFNLGLRCSCSYHHIPYVICVDVYNVLFILNLTCMVIDSSNIVGWHAFLYFLSWCLSFLHKVVRMTIKRLAFTFIDT